MYRSVSCQVTHKQLTDFVSFFEDDIPRAVGALTAAAAANPMNFCILTIPRHAPSYLDASLCETHFSTDTQNAGKSRL